MRLLYFFTIVALASGRFTDALGSPESQPDESPRSEPTCPSDEFYYGSKCRSCADLNNLFYNYQEWLAGETSPIVKIANTAEANARNKLNLAATTTTIASNKARIGKERPKSSSATNKIELGDTPVEDAMLARLISVDGMANQQDQSDYIDSTGGGGGGVGADDDDSGYIESDDQYADTTGATKQTQKWVADFLRTSLIENELLGLVEQCRQYQNTSACQMWSNLCVMTMYSYSDLAAASSPASSSASIQQQYPGSYDSPPPPPLMGRPDNGNNNNQFETTSRLRADSNKWQHCKQFTLTSICNSLREWHRVERRTEVQNIYSLEDPQTKLNTGLSFRLNQAIQLIAYRYSFDGRLISVEQFGLSDMAKFCAFGDRMIARADSLSEDNNVRLGKNLKLKCQFEASQLANNLKHLNETIFVDLYIAYPANGVMFVKPVPILIKNLIYNGFQVNRRKNAKDLSRSKLVHRFFLRSTFTISAESDKKSHPLQVALFAKSATLDLKFRQQEKGNAQLSSLMLMIDYGSFIRPQSSERNSLNSTNNLLAKRHLLEAEVSVSHSLIDMNSYKKDLDLVITILSILSSIWSLIKCYNVQKCYGVVKLDLETLIKLILIGCDTLGNLFALVNFAFLGYLFVTLKFQPNIQVLAPGEDLEAAILLNLKLAFLFKLIGIAYKLHTHLNVDIFFIDWEKPKMLTSNQILSHQTAYYNNNNIDQQQANGKNNPTTTNTFVGVSNQQQSSFWRPYTIMNRWLQLQTVRRQDITLQLLLFVCLVECFQITNLATADLNLDLSWTSNQSPSSSSSSSPSTKGNNGSSIGLGLVPQSSVTFRLFVLAIVYVTLSVCQIFYKKLISEPMLRNTIREFVDLCSVANVSLFCMLYPRFGYYIHGRNANGSGECGIMEMNMLLEREERDLCSKRGLAPNSDKQTFLLILPRIINDHYRKLLFTYDLLAPSSSSSSLWSSQQQQLIGNDHGFVGRDYNQRSANKSEFSSSYNGGGNNLLKSALNLSIIGGPTAASSSFSSNRALIESIMIKNKAINVFLINFLEHVYKDIDYSIRERRRFENFLFDVDFDETNDLGRGAGGGGAARLLSSTSRPNATATGGTNGARFNGPPMANPHQAAAMIAAGGGNKLTAATLCEDHQDSFTSLLWLGLEFDLVFLELFSLLILDCWLDQTLVLTTSLVWILHQSFKSVYIYLARQNLVCKALVDEKFLLVS